MAGLVALAFLALPSYAAWAQAPKDWAAGPFPRATTRAELAAYGGSGTSNGREGGGVQAGGQIQTCLVCIYSNARRLAWGDYQYLTLGTEGLELGEGVQAGYAVNDDVDVVGRLYYQWLDKYGAERRGVTLGAAARWKRFTAGLGVGPTDGTTVSASLRAIFSDFWAVTAFFDTVKTNDTVAVSGTSARVALGISF